MTFHTPKETKSINSHYKRPPLRYFWQSPNRVSWPLCIVPGRRAPPEDHYPLCVTLQVAHTRRRSLWLHQLFLFSPRWVFCHVLLLLLAVLVLPPSTLFLERSGEPCWKRLLLRAALVAASVAGRLQRASGCIGYFYIVPDDFAVTCCCCLSHWFCLPPPFS